MRKLFLAICFISYCFSNNAEAASRPVSNLEVNQVSKSNPIENVQEIQAAKERFKNMGKDEMNHYLLNRLQNVVKTNLEQGDGLGGDSAVSVEKTPEQLEIEAQANKSGFERMYDNAMNRLVSPKDEPRKAQMYTEQDPNQQDQQASDSMGYAQRQQMIADAQRAEWERTNTDVIEVMLPPEDKKTIVPAKEHIPYLFSRIELTPDGLTRVTDTIVVLANDKQLKKGIIRAFPKYVTTREGQRQKIDFSLMTVTVNGQEIDYKTVERTGYIFIEPKDDADLAPGTYTYVFNYLIDNQIFQYDEFDEFYWDMTGSLWNLVITRAGAAVIMPPNTKPLGQSAISGYPGYWSDQTVLISKEADNVLGFISQAPLFIGQGMKLIISIPKGAISNNSMTKKFLLFINEYGDIIFSALGLIAIALSYYLSWRYIRKNKKYKVLNINKDGPILRYLVKGAIDKKSFGAFLLDLYRKNIIDIEENDGNVLLVKKTDNLKSLSRYERKAINNLFTGSEAVLNVNSYSMLKVKRALGNITKGIRQQVKIISLKLNIGYAFFSIGMLLLAEIFIASLAYDFWYNLLFMLGTTIGLAFNLFLLGYSFTQKWQKWLIRTLATISMLVELFFLCAIIHPSTALILLATVYTIWEYSKLYSQRGGLMAASVNGAKEYQNLLVRKVNDISIGRDFVMNQAAIFALDVEDAYKSNESIKGFYKLDIIDDLIKKI